LIRYIVVILLGYCLGSFPTAYLLVKRKAKIDIRNAGTGNVGGMNAYEVTNSASLGIFIAAVDCLKGIAAVLVASLVVGDDFAGMSLGGLSSVLGHNYSPWIRFRGGRGLATAAGVMFMLGWIVVVIWATACGIGYAYSRNIHIANGIATVSCPVVIGFMPATVSKLLLRPDVPTGLFFVVVLVLASIIMIRHIQPLRDLLRTHHNSSTRS
jgi:glycerol-3-phosphate acyltransferase PlsY